MVKLKFESLAQLFIRNGHWSSMIDIFIINLISCLGPLLIPLIHIYIIYNFWHQYSRRVDKRYCTCSCWDTVFKGSYESGIASYKHVYFNATLNSAKIWVLTVLSVVSLYEALRRLTGLLLKRRLRLSMLVLFLSSIFSHYYSWWSFFNYLNDEFYDQWNRQLVFSVSELLSTTLVIGLADRRTPVKPLSVLVIVTIALCHVVISASDQFLANVVHHQGLSHQVVRDVALMSPDILHVILPVLELFCGSHCPVLLIICVFAAMASPVVVTIYYL